MRQQKSWNHKHTYSLQALQKYCRYPSRGTIPLSQERILPTPPSLHGLLFFYLLALGHGFAAGSDRSRGSAAGHHRSRGPAASQDRSRGSAAGPDRSRRPAAGQNPLHPSRHHSPPDTAADMVRFKNKNTIFLYTDKRKYAIVCIFENASI